MQTGNEREKSIEGDLNMPARSLGESGLSAEAAVTLMSNPKAFETQLATQFTLRDLS
jgi:hypothetical protein